MRRVSRMGWALVFGAVVGLWGCQTAPKLQDRDGILSPRQAPWKTHTVAALERWQPLRYAAAEEKLRIALEEAERIEPAHERWAARLNVLLIRAAFYARQTTSRLPDAESVLEAVLAMQEEALGPEDPAVATTLGVLARLDVIHGKYVRAKALVTRAVAIQEKALGPDHPGLATALNTLGEIYVTGPRPADKGQHAEAVRFAESLVRRALAIQERRLGPRHVDSTA